VEPTKIENKTSFNVLRTSIRQSTTQFRYANDNSKSLIQPESGYAYAYNISEVETALGVFENLTYKKSSSDIKRMTAEESLIQLGSQLCAHCPDEDVRHFAQKVVAHFIGEELQRSGELITLLAGDNLENPT
jgi:hypothetical protein